MKNLMSCFMIGTKDELYELIRDANEKSLRQISMGAIQYFMKNMYLERLII